MPQPTPLATTPCPAALAAALDEAAPAALVADVAADPVVVAVLEESALEEFADDVLLLHDASAGCGAGESVWCQLCSMFGRTDCFGATQV